MVFSWWEELLRTLLAGSRRWCKGRSLTEMALDVSFELMGCGVSANGQQR